MTATATGTATAKATATATETETASATAMVMSVISQSYRAWLVPALGSIGAAIRFFLFKHMATIMATMTVTGTAPVSAAATVTVRATATTITKISQLYRAWQVPVLQSKGAAIMLFLFKLMAKMMTTMT